MNTEQAVEFSILRQKKKKMKTMWKNVDEVIFNEKPKKSS